MYWTMTNRADQRAAALADRHYSRQKPGSRQFTPPGRVLVLVTPDYSAVWATSYPYAQYVHREYADAWCCCLFRNEGQLLSSDLILEAIAATRWRYGEPPASGMVTMIDADKVSSRNPGYCYKKAGFVRVGYTRGGLHILQMKPEDMPDAEAPGGVTLRLEWENAA